MRAERALKAALVAADETAAVLQSAAAGSAEVAAAQDLPSVFSAAAAATRATFGSDERTRWRVLVSAERGAALVDARGRKQPASRGLVGAAAASGEAVNTIDAAADERFDAVTDEGLAGPLIAVPAGGADRDGGGTRAVLVVWRLGAEAPAPPFAAHELAAARVIVAAIPAALRAVAAAQAASASLRQLRAGMHSAEDVAASASKERDVLRGVVRRLEHRVADGEIERDQLVAQMTSMEKGNGDIKRTLAIVEKLRRDNQVLSTALAKAAGMTESGERS